MSGFLHPNSFWSDCIINYHSELGVVDVSFGMLCDARSLNNPPCRDNHKILITNQLQWIRRGRFPKQSKRVFFYSNQLLHSFFIQHGNWFFLKNLWMKESVKGFMGYCAFYYYQQKYAPHWKLFWIFCCFSCSQHTLIPKTKLERWSTF